MQNRKEKRVNSMNPTFTTSVAIVPLQEPLGYHQQWFALGSCFSGNMGRRLSLAGFHTCINPFGVLFNPFSISASIQRLRDTKLVTEEELFMQGSVWNHFDFSNLHSGVDKSVTLQQMNKAITQSSEKLQSSGVLLITFGTSWVYESKLTGRIVANCHKLPANRFNRRRLTVDEIVNEYSQLIASLPEDLKIVFTVSPVRHWKDGAHENTLSKSILHLAVDELISRFSSCTYFPAYELVLDELRDYRFFNDDMVHPSDLAIDFVWQQFVSYGFSPQTRTIIREAEHFRQMQNHRSIHPESDEHKAFIRKTELQREALLKRYPFLNLRADE
jgi:hypothetical protein